MKLNVLVTGALGHIGSSLIRTKSFLSKCERIVLLDDLSSERYTSLFDLRDSGCKFKFVEGRSIDAKASIDFGSLDYVIHLAALTDALASANHPDLVWAANHDSTLAIADACHEFGVALVFPSSTSIYGSQSAVVSEDCTELQPQSPYAESKIAEEALLVAARNEGLRTTILRLGTVFGTSPGMRFHTAVNRFCWQAVNRQPISVWSTAMDQKRPYLAVQDACEAIAHCIGTAAPFEVPAINLVSENATVRDVIEAIAHAGIVPRVEFVASPIMNQLSFSVESLFAEEVGFVFRGNIREGVAETIGLLKGIHSGE